ncbi:unnamed protein product [Heterobilharzia americana]|nr:unnamed protein product [Heterobilharzia americana]
MMEVYSFYSLPYEKSELKITLSLTLDALAVNMFQESRKSQVGLETFFFLAWYLFSNQVVIIPTAKAVDTTSNSHWLDEIHDDDLKQMIEEGNITEEQLRNPYQFDRLLKRLIFLSPKHLRRFMKVLREWNNLSQRIRYGR